MEYMQQGDLALTDREYDVLVYGAGPAGISAAVAAAARGQRTLLIDDGPDVGGASVCGLLNTWHGEHDAPHMELVRELSRKAWGRQLFEPEELSRAFRKRLGAAGVKLMLNAGISRVKCKNGIVRSASFAAGEGRVKLAAWSYVDASENMALTRLALDCYDGVLGGSSIAVLARIGGIDTRVQGVFDASVLGQYAAQFRQEQALDELPAWLPFPELIPCLRGGTAVLSAAGEGIRVGEGATGLTAAEDRCRENIFEAIGFLQRNVPGYENCYLIQFAPRPLYLEAPRPARLRKESEAAYESDAIEDIPVMRYHGSDGLVQELSVPLGGIMCRGIGNLLLARTESMRPDQVPLLLACGDAAGRVASQSVLYDGDIAKLDAERLKKALTSNIND